MAVVSNPLIGKSKQSAGGVTFTSWKGRNVLKNKATSVANPQTPAQVANRNQFSGVSKFYSKYRAVFSLAMLRMMGNMTDGNKFAMLNKSFFETDSVGILNANLPSVVAAIGDLGEIRLISVVFNVGSNFEVAYDYTPNPLKSQVTDKIRVIVFDHVSKIVSFVDTVIDSANGVAVVPTALTTCGNACVWAFSFSESGRLLSNSVGRNFMIQ